MNKDPRYLPKKRRCLSCDKVFVSPNCHIRICLKCKETRPKIGETYNKSFRDNKTSVDMLIFSLTAFVFTLFMSGAQSLLANDIYLRPEWDKSYHIDDYITRYRTWHLVENIHAIEIKQDNSIRYAYRYEKGIKKITKFDKVKFHDYVVDEKPSKDLLWHQYVEKTVNWKESRLDLAHWCKEQGLGSEYIDELNSCVMDFMHDGNSVEAGKELRKLGYVYSTEFKYYMKEEEEKRLLGFVRYKKKWVMPIERERLMYKDKQDEEKRKRNVNYTKWVNEKSVLGDKVGKIDKELAKYKDKRFGYQLDGKLKKADYYDKKIYKLSKEKYSLFRKIRLLKLKIKKDRFEYFGLFALTRAEKIYYDNISKDIIVLQRDIKQRKMRASRVKAKQRKPWTIVVGIR